MTIFEMCIFIFLTADGVSNYPYHPIGDADETNDTSILCPKAPTDFPNEYYLLLKQGMVFLFSVCITKEKH